MTAKIKRRRRQVWRRRIRLALVTILVLGIVAGLTWLIGWSQVLASKSVKVTGVSTLGVEEVTSVASVPMDVPLVRLDTKPIAQRVSSLPQVAKVKVSRSWPTTVRVDVTERTPVYVVHGKSGEFRLVDVGGVAYLPVPQAPEGLMVAEMADGAPVRLLADLATVVSALTPELRGGVIYATSPDNIAVDLPDGRTVVFGSAEQAGLKADVATKLLAGVKATVYDVSAPSRPVVR